jgi:hypothetical protein|tara:strand:+ start:1084 stop:1452 length:369 start_codon:yes stop_codon:yes gene_type:complete
MAHFAKIGTGNIVEQVLVVNNDVITDENGNEQEKLGMDFLNNLLNTRDVWKQTSYNENFKKNYAGVGYTYDESRDAFIPPKDYPSWTLNEDTCRWEAPSARPDDGKDYSWNEETTSWEEIIN